MKENILSYTIIIWKKAKKGHKNKKWLVSSISWLRRHLSEGVSMKLWRFLWYLKELRHTLSWNRYRSPKGSCIPKILFSLDESKIKYGFKNTERWNVVKMSNDDIPRSNFVFCYRFEFFNPFVFIFITFY